MIKLKGLDRNLGIFECNEIFNYQNKVDYMHDKGIQIKNDSEKVNVEKSKLLKGILNIVKDISSVSGLGNLPIHAFESIEAFKLKDDIGSIAWKLICRSLTDSLCTLISEANLDISKDIIVTEDLEDDLNTKLESGEYFINSDFFKNPGKISLINDLKPTLTEFLALFEFESLDIENILNRLHSYFVFSLAKEWRQNYKIYSILEEHIHTPFDESTKNEEGWLLYSQWIKQQIDKPVFSESFSLRQIYIPLRAYYNIKPQERNKVKSDVEIKQEEQKKHVVDLEKELINWVKKSDKDDAIRIIRGGPGIGKSSFLKMFAAKLVDQGRNVLFIPMHLFEIRTDLIDAVKNFFKYDDFINEDPFKVDKIIIIIFDGLDELSMQGKVLAEVANQFLQEVTNKVMILNKQKIKLQCIISGRDVVVQQNESGFRNEGQILRLIPYLIHDKEKEKYSDENGLLVIDQRNIWWKQYGKLNGKNYEKLPDNLINPDLDEITAQPLLNYLVALSYNIKQIKGKEFNFNQVKNLNIIYSYLLDAVYYRKYSEGKDLPILGLRQKDFNDMLEEIALATWHGDGRTTTVAEIEKHLKGDELKSKFDLFLKNAEKGIISLLAAFYFSQTSRNNNDTKTFEFTHKSFGEYLTSKGILNKLIQININYNLRISSNNQGWDVYRCLVEWIKIFGTKEIDDDLVKFIKNEIELLFEEERKIIIQMQDTIIKLINYTLKYGMPMEIISNKPSYYEINNQAINSEKALLIILGIISNQTKVVSDIQFPTNTSFGEWLSRLIGQSTGGFTFLFTFMTNLNLSHSILLRRDLRDANLRGANLRDANLSDANLRGANLRDANLSRANLNDANLRGANLSGAILRGANLIATNLSGADLSGADLRGANTNSIFLSFVNLRGANLNGVDLRGANLSRANLNDANLRGANLSGAILSGADLADTDLMDAYLAKADLRKINLVSTWVGNAPKEDIVKFIKEIIKAKNVKGIELDFKILDIIKSEFTYLYRRIIFG